MVASAQDLYETRWRLYVAMIALIGHRHSLKRFFKKRNVLHPGMSIIDAGCGSGALTRALWELSQEQHLEQMHFFGFDVTKNMLATFQTWIHRSHAHNIRLLQADVLDLAAFAIPGGADLVVTSGMLEYVPKDKLVLALKNLRHLVMPTGRVFIFITRNTLYNRLLIGRLWHANIYCEAELRSSLHNAGLRVDSLNRFKTWGFVIEASWATGR
jgi:ubiquinone/menaquinone biosynthesis C-methylase UbiE